MRVHDGDHRCEPELRTRTSRLESESAIPPKAPPCRPLALAGPASIAALQRAAGNAAVSAMLGGNLKRSDRSETNAAPRLYPAGSSNRPPSKRPGDERDPAIRLDGVADVKTGDPDRADLDQRHATAPAPAWVQRCGIGSSCDCSEEEKEASVQRDSARRQAVVGVQRDHDQTPKASACAVALDDYSGIGPAGPAQAFQAEIAAIEISSDHVKAIELLKRIWMTYGLSGAGLYLYHLLKRMWIHSGSRMVDQFADRFVGRVKIDHRSITFADYRLVVGMMSATQKRLHTESARFITCYEEQARATALGALDESRERVTNEVKHYFGSWGLVQDAFGSDQSRTEGEDHASRRGLGIAAEGLAKRRNALIKANAAYRGSVWNRSLDLAGRKPIEDAQEDADRDYEIFRSQVIPRFPILEAVSSAAIDAWNMDVEPDDEEGQQLQQLAQLTHGNSKDAATFIVNQILGRLEHIAKIRKELKPGGKVNVWRVPRIVEATSELTGARPDTFYGKIVEDQVNRKPPDSWTNHVIEIVEIGLYLLAPFTEGITLIPAAMLTTARAGYRAYEHWKEYETQKALRGTDFGAAALSAEDPSLLWLAADITAAFAEIGLSVVPAAEVFRALTPAARAARAAMAGEETLLALESAAKELTVERLGAGKADQFAARVAADARSARSGGLGGMTAEEASLLNQAEAQTGRAFGKRAGVRIAVGASLPGKADQVLGAAVERKLAKAGATEMVEGARSAVRAGKTEEAELLFVQLEEHLTAEEASLLWRDLGRGLESATRLAKPITLLNERHWLKLVEGEDGAFFVLCSWCTRVRNVLLRALKQATQGGEAIRISRLQELIRQVELMETNITKVAKGEATSVATMRTLMGKLTEAEHVIGSALHVRPATSTPNFTALARDPGVANRASDLYKGYLDQLWATRREIFAGRKAKDKLWEEVEKEARARALMQARRESARGAPLELAPGAAARTTVNPRADIPFGFYDRPDFDLFSKRLNAALTAPDAKLLMEGSAVTGRRYERIAAPFGPTGSPFDLGRLSDFDVAIVSDSLFARAQAARNPRIPMGGDLAAPQTEQLSSAHLKKLGLTDLDHAAHEGILDATGIAHPVHFVIRPSSAPAKLSLPLTGGGT